MENSCTCDVCNVDVLKEFLQKQLGKKHLENMRQNDIAIPEGSFKEAQSPIKNQI